MPRWGENEAGTHHWNHGSGWHLFGGTSALSLGYEVHGLVRQTNLESQEGGRTGEVLNQCLLHAISLDSFPGLHRLIEKYKFDECYHLASVSFVGEYLADGFHTMVANISGTHFLLATLQDLQADCRFYFAGSSEMFGRPHRGSAVGADTISSAQSLRDQQGDFSSSGAELSGVVRHVLRDRHSVQS